MAVLQEVLRMTYDHHIQLQSRHGQHSMTTEAQSVFTDLSLKTSTRIIGDTELKKAPMKYLVPALATTVYEYCSYRLINCHRGNVMTLLMTIPGSELPWYRLIERIHGLGRLPELISEVKKTSGLRPPVIQNNISASSSYVATALAQACYDDMVDLIMCSQL